MYTISTNGSPKSIIKHIKYKLNEQQYIEMGRTACCRTVNIVRPARCRNPLCEGRTRGIAALPPDLWRDVRMACCWAVNTRRPTSLMGSEGTIEIVALPGSTSDRRVSLRPSLFTFTMSYETSIMLRINWATSVERHQSRRLLWSNFP